MACHNLPTPTTPQHTRLPHHKTDITKQPHMAIWCAPPCACCAPQMARTENATPALLMGIGHWPTGKMQQCSRSTMQRSCGPSWCPATPPAADPRAAHCFQWWVGGGKCGAGMRVLTTRHERLPWRPPTWRAWRARPAAAGGRPPVPPSRTGSWSQRAW